MFIGNVMKATSLGPSPRNAPIGDTVLSWLSNLVFLQVIPDLRNKAFNWGKTNGLPNVYGEEDETPQATTPPS
jgi:3-dehydrosphinganine reductase